MPPDTGLSAAGKQYDKKWNKIGNNCKKNICNKKMNHKILFYRSYGTVPCHGIVEFSKIFLLEGTFVPDLLYFK
jgi:hypothetical protein